MQNIFSKIFIISIATFLIGCSYNENNDLTDYERSIICDELTREIILEIKDNYCLNRNVEESYISTYCGCFNGAYAVYMNGAATYPDVETVESVGGYDFKYGCSHLMDLYVNNSFISLTVAYENNTISNEDLSKLYAAFLEKGYCRTRN